MRCSTKYRYDLVRRRTLVVQSYQPSTFTDPALWTWNASAAQWRDGKGAAITFGTANDQNVIVQSSYDQAGRRTAQRDPRGNLTSYRYDQLNRRIRLTDPLSHTWQTVYATGNAGVTTTTLVDANGNTTVQTTDRLGRLARIQYLNESPKNTPDVTFLYDKGGNQLQMSESTGGATPVRVTGYAYDQARRLRQANFDTNGDGIVDQSVSYQYEPGGLRNLLTLPDGKTIRYSYDARGRLTSLTDWSSQATSYSYDGGGRLTSIQRSNGLNSTAVYDAASRLTSLSHVHSLSILASFSYTLNALGNRTGVVESQALTPSGGDNHNLSYSYDALARLSEAIYRSGGTLGYGTLQRQYDYQYDLAGNRTQQIANVGSTTTTNYTYNTANQLASDGNTYSYDNNGNLLNNGSTTNYTWDRANRLRSWQYNTYTTDFYLYDGLGRRLQQAYTSGPLVNYTTTTTNYVPDLQLGLWQVLQAVAQSITYPQGSDPIIGPVQTTDFVHDPLGFHQQYNPDSTWHWAVKDGLGTVRGVVDSSAAVQESRLYSPFGELSQTSGSLQSPFGFTGEETDGNGLVNLRMRYYNPTLGQFMRLDPLEGAAQQPMSLNRYMYVQGNVINMVDPSGLCQETPADTQCLTNVQQLECTFRGMFIYWNNRQFPVCSPSTSGIPYPTPTNPTACPSSNATQNYQLPLEPVKEWTADEVGKVYRSLQMYSYALTGQENSQLCGYFNRVLFIKSGHSALGGGKTIRDSRWTDGGFAQYVAQANYNIVLYTSWWDQSTQTGQDDNYRYWLVLHELSHVLASQGGTGTYDSLATSTITNFPNWRSKLGSPTPYSRGEIAGQTERTYAPVEYMVESIMGVVWNAIHSKYDLRATGANIDFVYENNVCDIYGNTGQSLNDWVMQDILGKLPIPAIGNPDFGQCNR